LRIRSTPAASVQLNPKTIIASMKATAAVTATANMKRWTLASLIIARRSC